MRKKTGAPWRSPKAVAGQGEGERMPPPIEEHIDLGVTDGGEEVQCRLITVGHPVRTMRVRPENDRNAPLTHEP